MVHAALAFAGSVPTHLHLGGHNKPWDRVHRVGATLFLLQYALRATFSGFGFDVDEWNTASSKAETEIEDLCRPHYQGLTGEEL